MKKTIIYLLASFILCSVSRASEPLIANIYARDITFLNGQWNYIVDPFDNGLYDNKMQRLEKGFFENRKPRDVSERIEYNFDTSPLLKVPSDWNTQEEKLFFYEGTIWYKKDFTYTRGKNKVPHIYFGAVNYEAQVYVNGKYVGEHKGGYTPFNFNISDFVNEGRNFIVLRTNNARHKDNVPTSNMDWWNFGGITRDVLLVDLPAVFVQDYSIQLDKEKKGIIKGWVKLNQSLSGQEITVEIPELSKVFKGLTDDNGFVSFEMKAQPTYWSSKDPKLYDVDIAQNGETVKDKIGFRTIKTEGKKILLNDEEVFLKGICLHEEAAYRNGRAWSKDEVRTLLMWVKELGCNFVRLTHYPHNEYMVRLAEEMGIMIWSEIPVYWTISWDNPETYQNAEKQLDEMIYRDKNRSAIIVWSIANETPHGESRDKFLKKLSDFARSKDDTRLISMAMEVSKVSDNTNLVQDNMSEYVDIISFNQYLGWYNGTPEDCRTRKWEIPYDKPIIVSEFGGDALQGYHGESNVRWTEEYQEELYKATLEMLNKIDGLAGISPWVLKDFYSPRRQLPGIQDWFNRKGIVSDQGIKKKAFFVLQDWFKTK